ncbi:MAG: D-alanyl-D-alanine carboxypeptidase, partial [Symploca sp. SIO2B6]|nr:D-alanyl-D-alanine carboxypeptidase [Symploca sp. SIO2B6]
MNHGSNPWPNKQWETAAQPTHYCTAPLTTAIAPIMNQSTFAEGTWGIVIASLSTGEWLYSHNANQYFVPASNIKLLTTAAALTRLEFPTSDLLTAFYDWVGVTNRTSNNRYAEALFRRVGGTETI